MSDYPVRVAVAEDDGQNRLWGIPILGIVVRAILVIPHALLLFVLGLVLYAFLFVSWIPILLNGRMAGWGYTLVGGYLRISVRTALYVALVTGRYPPFDLGGEHSVAVSFDRDEVQNRLWGIPIAGMAVRAILLIPHAIVLWFLGIAVALISLVTWIPILVNGRQAAWIVHLFAGYYRWITRVFAYALMLTEHYPPFRLDD